MRICKVLGSFWVLLALVAAGCGDDKGGTTTAESTGSVETTTAAAAPSPGECVDAWNATSNSASKQELATAYAASTAAGDLIVGADGGSCVLASFREGDPNGAVYTQDGGTFRRSDDVSLSQYDQFRSSIAGVSIVLSDGGTVQLA